MIKRQKNQLRNSKMENTVDRECDIDSVRIVIGSVVSLVGNWFCFPSQFEKLILGAQLER